MTTKQILLNKCKITFIISKIDIIQQFQGIYTVSIRIKGFQVSSFVFERLLVVEVCIKCAIFIQIYVQYIYTQQLDISTMMVS